MRRPPSLASAALGGLLACLLLVLGLPQLLGAVAELDAAAALDEVHAGRTPDRAALDAGVAALEAADRWEPGGVREAERGLLLTYQADAALPGAARDRLYGEALDATAEGLRRAPGQPHAWARLAALRERTGDRRGAVEALRMSMLSGPVEPAMMMWRIDMALRLLPAMDADTLSMLRRQIRLAWVIAPEGVAELSKRAGVGDLVRDSLALLTEEEMAHYIRLHGKR